MANQDDHDQVSLLPAPWGEFLLLCRLAFGEFLSLHPQLGSDSLLQFGCKVFSP